LNSNSERQANDAEQDQRYERPEKCCKCPCHPANVAINPRKINMDLNTEQIGKAASSPFAVGLLGSLVALRSAPGVTWQERLTNVISGAVMAGFLSPAIAEWFGLHSPAMQSATAFVVGLFGLNITATAFQWIRDMKLADLLPWRK
jgi:hypothetical protein